jgi:hypothetical protein
MRGASGLQERPSGHRGLFCCLFRFHSLPLDALDMAELNIHFRIAANSSINSTEKRWSDAISGQGPGSRLVPTATDWNLGVVNQV